MKRVFRFKKGQKTDWDEPIIYFLMEYLTNMDREGFKAGDFPAFRKNWKVTIIVEEVKKK